MTIPAWVKPQWDGKLPDLSCNSSEFCDSAYREDRALAPFVEVLA